MKLIKNINIGLKYKPFIVAELSGNHNQSISRAYKLISLAKELEQVRLNFKHLTQI